ncbi:Crp/Fnr family transcriptional regulator [Micromonospora sp. WMMC241]|uniref:Crp/Fnr family transcriptional regulator n=1 Tax=Micromonospora sp. WMMC241 TaxID=3015159 RepID=UPI003FA5FA3B
MSGAAQELWPGNDSDRQRTSNHPPASSAVFFDRRTLEYRHYEWGYLWRRAATEFSCSYSPSQVLFKENDEAHSVWIVRSGVVRLVSHTGQLVGVLRRGEALTDALSGIDYPYMAIATTRTRVVAFPVDDFRRLLRSNPSWSRRVVANQAQRSRLERIEQCRFQGGSRERLVRTLVALLPAERMEAVLLSLTNLDLARLISVSSSSMDMALSALTSRKIIESIYAGIAITDPPALIQFDAVATQMYLARNPSQQPYRLDD